MIPFSKVDQVLQEPFVKQNIRTLSFHLVPDTYSTIKIYILSRHPLRATSLTKVVLFEGGLPGILSRKYLSFSIVNYLSSIKAEVRKFATFS